MAIKTLRPELAINPQAKERFLREARAAAKLEHDNIIPIYSVGEAADGTPFLAMPLLKGEPLDALIRRTAGPLPVAMAVRLARPWEKRAASNHMSPGHRGIGIAPDTTIRPGSSALPSCLAGWVTPSAIRWSGAIWSSTATRAPLDWFTKMRRLFDHISLRSDTRSVLTQGEGWPIGHWNKNRTTPRRGQDQLCVLAAFSRS